MLPESASEPMAPAEDREARIQALLAQLRPAAERSLRAMAELLVDKPDAQLLGAVEYELRDAAQRLATDAHQTGLESRKKGGIRAVASTARTAKEPPASSTTCHAPC
jgi:hypothetical protein